MGLGFTEVLIIIIVLLLIFGAGKIPKIMKDLGSGMKEFKKGMKDDADDEKKKPKSLEQK